MKWPFIVHLIMNFVCLRLVPVETLRRSLQGEIGIDVPKETTSFEHAGTVVSCVESYLLRFW